MLDLPKVKSKEFPEDSVLEYVNSPSNEYQKKMRVGSSKLYNHIPMQHTDKTIQKFAFLLENNGEELPEELKPRVRGNLDEISNSSYSEP